MTSRPPDVEVNRDGQVMAARDIRRGEVVLVPASMLRSIVQQSAAACPKGSCRRHGKCMYLHYQHCPMVWTMDGPD